LRNLPITPEAIHFTITKTSHQIGVIFAFDCDTTNFETFESWINDWTSRSANNNNELFDLCYILNSTFTYTFEDLDRKNKAKRCIYPLSKSVTENYGKLENREDFEEYKDDIRNPCVQFFTTPRIVDLGVGFLNFLTNLYYIWR